MRKGIVLAGGTGSRLYPATKGISKQLLPVYDKPLVYYPISILMLAGIREILIVTTPEESSRFQSLLGDGSDFGVSFRYSSQPEPNGLPAAFLIGESFLGSDPAALILGDNLFHGTGLTPLLKKADSAKRGATIFTYWVRDPRSYGIVVYDDNGRPVAVEEKPAQPVSHHAITGLYYFDNDVISIAKSLHPSARGELEITDVIQAYLDRNELQAIPLGRGFAWLDTGTHDSLLDASNYVATMERQQGIRIACLEEIAWRKGWLSSAKVETLAAGMGNNDYRRYLLELIKT